MLHGEFFTWSRQLQIGVVNGRLPAEMLRERTLSITYVDRDRNFDHIEWELDNFDGQLTRPENIATGLVVRMRLGYEDGAFPWKAFIINRVKGGMGVYGKMDAAVGESESKVTFYGRNRNARGGRASKTFRKSVAAPRKKPAKVFGSTNDITAQELVLGTEDNPKILKAKYLSDAVEQIAARNGFEGDFAFIEPTEDPLESQRVTIPDNQSDGEFLLSEAKRLGYIFKIDNTGLHWHRRHWAGAKLLLADTLIYGESPDILQITFDCDFRLPVPNKATARGYSYRNRMLTTYDAVRDAADGQLNMGVAYGGLIAEPARAAVLTRHERFPARADTTDKAARKALDRYMKRHMRAFQVNIDTVGNPLLLARRLVLVKGTGSPFLEKPLYISEARHLMEESTYRTQLIAKHPPKSYGSGPTKLGTVHDPIRDLSRKQLKAGAIYVVNWPSSQSLQSVRPDS